MTNKENCFRYNVTDIASFQSFTNIKPQTNEVYFLQIIGGGSNYLHNIRELDQTLNERTQQGYESYIRIKGLAKLNAPQDIQYYSSCYDDWIACNKQSFCLKSYKNETIWNHKLGELCLTIQRTFLSCTPNVTASIEKNFMIKFMFWLDSLQDFLIASKNEQLTRRFVISEISKKHEYLFCYALTLLGIHVMILLPKTPMEPLPFIDNIVKKVVVGQPEVIQIPDYQPNPVRKPCIRLDEIRREQTKQTSKTDKIQELKELEFEELALRASSVVMIAVHDKKGDVISTGSGIMIGRNGYILTNNHVACGGVAYSVRIEDDEQTYETQDIIKYNPLLDLAIIRIDRLLNPLPIYNREKALVRGQKVVAIGSPLGLFNSVSNGIISGFRTMRNDVSMIQFTAPISHGSSGGALLNMYGEVIGISTAGIDEGQNLNLAVGYSDILPFVRGFI